MPMPKEGAILSSGDAARAALAKHGGVLQRAARELGVPREELRKQVESDPELVEFRRNQLVDEAEARIADLTAGENESVQLRAASFVLTHLGADRGWRKSKDVRIPMADLRVINAAIAALINRFVTADQQEDARSYFRERMREGFQKAGGFRRIA